MAYVEQGGKLVWQDAPATTTPQTTTQLNQTTGLMEKVPVSVTDLGNTPTPQVETPVPTKADPYMDSIKKYQDEYKALSQSVVNPYEQKMNDLTTQYETALGQQGSKAEALESAYAQAGIPEQQKKLQDLNLQIAQMTASYDKGLVDIEGKVMPMQFITGQQAQMQKMKAAEVGALTSIQQAMTGNIELARETAREAVALKFEDEQNRIDSIRSQLELNYENFSREEKKKADEMNFVLNKQQEEIDKQMREQDGISEIMAMAAQNGADNATLKKIMTSKNVQDAILRSGGYLSDMASKMGSGAPVKIGQDSYGKDIFYVEGYGVVSGDELLGVIPGGPNDVIAQQFDPTAYNYAEAIRDGKYKLTDIKDDNLREKVLSIQKTLPPAPQAISEAESMVSKLEGLLNHPGLNSAVGPIGLTRIPIWDAGGNKDAFLMQAAQVISKEALNNLIEAKSRGATFGALSDTEMRILQSAATALGSRALTNKSGMLKGFDTSEKAFKTELTKMIGDYKDLIQKAKDPLQISFSQGGSGTPTATLSKVLTFKDGEKGGQCGRFVNQLTGYKLSLGDSYQSKISKMDPTITRPEPGMVFVTPYKDTGHTGFVVAVNNDGTVTVRDSNYGLDEKVRTRKMPISKITGLARV